MLWKGFQRPKRVDVDTETLTPTYGRFTAQPFERGFATTIGNALRRCLLSSIEGAAITAVNIEGVLHEFSSIPGVQEDVTDIILNLKQAAITLHSEDSKVLSIDVEGPGAVTAGQMGEDPQIEIVDPNVHIATVNEEGRLKLQAQVKRGRGYVSADRNFDESMGIGWIPVDSAHSPVRRVNYRVEAARLGQTTDYERLILEVWTNGTVRPEEAVSLAAMLLKDHLGIFIQTEESLRHDGNELGREELAGLDAVLAKNIDELDLSVRSANSLKNANIHTLRDLVRRTEKDMLETKNFGKKSLEEVQEVLDKLGLSLGMDVPERPAGGASA
ncbi:MAG TPA: DNA-directed RNA polymerase subunit alpha [Thermoanaerobaculia bacterium]|jgi:DNA-directed RNA polymerase subunit alpha|nr:DNA-directed RNA polymerase subunit alpha [Thermoanaerobaculia bacterium]